MEIVVPVLVKVPELIVQFPPTPWVKLFPINVAFEREKLPAIFIAPAAVLFPAEVSRRLPYVSAPTDWVVPLYWTVLKGPNVCVPKFAGIEFVPPILSVAPAEP